MKDSRPKDFGPKDFGTSDNPAVQAQLDRLAALSLPDGRSADGKLGLDTMRALLARIGDPHRKLPPVFHIAGTNGKGSTCAFLRAMLEADGKTVHVTTSPHLVRYNERIRIAGKLIEDDDLAALLKEVLDAAEGLQPSFFEVTIAAAFLAFSRNPADACIVEVGLGGRLDATNIIERPAMCGIAALGIDHERFLLAPEEGVPADPMARIAFEKAGIAKDGVPLVTLGALYPPQARAALADAARKSGAPLFEYGEDWTAEMAGDDNRLAYSEGGMTKGAGYHLHTLPLSLLGPHQALNAGLAIAMLRQQAAIQISEEAIRNGVAKTKWPGRLHRLTLTASLAGTREVWLDGGHNRSAGEALARHFASHFSGRKIHLIIGMIEGKDPAALTGPLADSLASITAVPISTHPHHPPRAYSPDAKPASSWAEALANLPDDELPALIAGSVYLAGDVLRMSGEMPD